uniref:Uncharacterized protein n=1 Tax=Chenopodium quinoa TaxID=63459 RepID=A0A803MY29_CHEQI
MSEKRCKNLCYWCNEKFEPGYRCKGKKPQVLHIEVEDELEEEKEMNEQLEANGSTDGIDDPRISLQALDGNCRFHTMRMRGKHGKHPLHILLDSGSTHNFVDTTTALKLG